jgi:hypothetical protein
LQIVWRHRLPAIAPASGNSQAKKVPIFYSIEIYELFIKPSTWTRAECTTMQQSRTRMLQASGQEVDALLTFHLARKKLLLNDHKVISLLSFPNIEPIKYWFTSCLS